MPQMKRKQGEPPPTNRGPIVRLAALCDLYRGRDVALAAAIDRIIDVVVAPDTTSEVRIPAHVVFVGQQFPGSRDVEDAQVLLVPSLGDRVYTFDIRLDIVAPKHRQFAQSLWLGNVGLVYSAFYWAILLYRRQEIARAYIPITTPDDPQYTHIVNDAVNSLRIGSQTLHA